MKKDIGGAKFDGPDYDHEEDHGRLTGQIQAIYDYMMSVEWKTLKEIEDALGYPQASISAQLRHLRKPKFGSHTVEKQKRGERNRGLFEYRIAK